MLLVFDVTPKKGMHVYAPGTKYRPVAIALEDNPALAIHETLYPPPTKYLFTPLDEEVLVYQAPFRLTLDVTPDATPAQRAVLTAQARLTIKGQLTYQACDDKVCYLPTSISFEFTANLKNPNLRNR